MNQYTELYKRFEIERLFKILEEEEKFNKMAILAAKNELESRGVTKEEIVKFQQEIVENAEALKREAESLRAQNENSIDVYEDYLFKTIDKIQHYSINPEDEKKQRFLALLLIANTIYSLYEDLDYFPHMLFDSLINIYQNIFYLMLNAIWLYAIYAFWKKKQIGWILIVAIFIIDIIPTLLLWAQQLYFYSSLYPITGNLKYYFLVFFNLGLLYLMLIPEIMRLYFINRNILIKSLGAGLIVVMSLYIIPYILLSISG